jgi:hypothetical protein
VGQKQHTFFSAESVLWQKLRIVKLHFFLSGRLRKKKAIVNARCLSGHLSVLQRTTQ